MRRCLQIAVVLLLSLLATAAHARRMAILELRGSLEREALVALTNAVRAGAVDQLRGTDISVMTRENMAVLLQDMGLSVDCAEGACEVETGRNLGASLVVAGEILRVEDKLLADLKLYETESGTLLATERALGDGQLQLLDALEPAAASLLRRISGGTSAPRRPRVAEGSIGEDEEWSIGSVEQKVVVAFDSEPDGAVVRLDGALLCQSTPCSREVTAGPHEVLMEKERYHLAKTRTELKRGVSIDLDLAPRFGWLSARTEPIGITLSVNGEPAQVVKRREVEPGVYEVVINDPCWKRLGERVVLDEGEEESITIKAKPRESGIQVTVQDDEGNAVEASVFVDRLELGRTPGTFKVPLCSKEIEVRTDDRRSARQGLKLQEKAVESVSIVMPKRASPKSSPPARSTSGSRSSRSSASPSTSSSGYTSRREFEAALSGTVWSTTKIEGCGRGTDTFTLKANKRTEGTSQASTWQVYNGELILARRAGSSHKYSMDGRSPRVGTTLSAGGRRAGCMGQIKRVK